MRLVKVYCGTCGTVFGGRLALKSHYRNSPGCSADDPFTEDIKYHCRLCNEQFDMKVNPFVLRNVIPTLPTIPMNKTKCGSVQHLGIRFIP